MTLVDIVFRLNAIASPYFHHIRLTFAYRVNLLARSWPRVCLHAFMDLRRKVARGEAGGRFVITVSDWPGPVFRLSEKRAARYAIFPRRRSSFFSLAATRLE